MSVRRFPSFARIALGLTIALAAAACADEDPRFGGAGAIKNVQVFETPRPPAPAEGGPNLSARQLFAQIYAVLQPACAGCHAPPGIATAPKFFGADEEASYAEFKARNYHLPGGKPEGSKYSIEERGGPHPGRAVSNDEKALISRWRDAEKTGGAGPTDAGTGG